MTDIKQAQAALDIIYKSIAECNPAYDICPVAYDALAAGCQALQHYIEREQGWRDIESAPRDGTVVFIFGGYTNEVLGGATSSRQFNKYGETCKFYDGEWVTLSESVIQGIPLRRVENPTHWMPLPPAPTNNEGGE